MKIIARFFIIFAFIILPNTFASMPMEINLSLDSVNPIGLNEAEKISKEKDVYFLDANDERVYKQRHIPNAINVNVSNVLSFLPDNKNIKIVLYGLNSASIEPTEIATILQKDGYNNLYYMLEGIDAWALSGRKVDSIFHKTEQLTQKKIQNYKDGIHDDLLFANLPACRDCHASPKVVYATKQEKEELFRDKEFVNDNCKTCHKKEKSHFEKSVHSPFVTQDLKEGRKLPNCTDCHGVHIADKNGKVYKELKQLSQENCGVCHEKQQSLYHETFHGKALLLNKPGDAIRVAACYDCHGTHNVLNMDKEESTLHINNRVKTCGECHVDSNINFVGFIAHADHTDAEKYPLLHTAYVFMTGLVIVVFLFFGVHTLLWSMKLIQTRMAYPKEWKEAKQKAHNDKMTIKRFSTLHLIQHLFMASSFLGLAFSGLPQKFYTAPWANKMIELMGGIEVATFIHHLSAVIMFAVFFSHIAEIIVVQTRKGKGFFSRLFDADSLVPRIQDFKDMKAHFLWFFGKGERPQFDRWTYWEKFDYIAVFWGMFIIGFSGLVLWFPTFFSNFMPGWMINLSTLVHSDEALLATGFIFAIHFFNTHFRADRFPMDMVIFSGTLTEEEIKQERKHWYDRLVKNGDLKRLYHENENYAWYKPIAKFAGFAMLITGLVFLFMMIYAYIVSIF
ncbi:rhodanese-like domain-containing protein [Campylobacter pinnipediorum]|uniref:rhodanese-like domain-containing protein n=1 Tax=Campylobacter pinnipediorum TaxID=1965231 RepID=UPI00084D5D69|nr:rhodanese-like domain-containing protein [Campylobacter pinnipediorum]OPA79561.1 hypothetical protein BFG05_00190 [Campylobacter pinnipediorum subsp. pinnipediorum]